MNFRLTAALLGTVFVVAAGLLLMSFFGDKERAPETLFPDLYAAGITAEKPEKIDALEFERADGSTLVIARTDKDKNAWQIQKPINARADAAKVMQVVTALLKAKPTKYTEISTNPAIHGLDPAGLKVTLRVGTERSSTLSLGDVTMGDKGVVFVTTSNQPKLPMAVRRGDLDALFRDDARNKDGKMVDLAKWSADFRTTNVFPSDSRSMGEDVTAVKLELPNKKQTLALSRTGLGSPWKFDSPAGWGDADTEGDPHAPPDKLTGVGPLLRALANVSAQSPSDFIDNPGDLKQYGLNPDDPNRIRIEMKTNNGQSAVVYFGKIEAGSSPPPPLPGMPVPPHAAAKVYVTVEGLPGVIRASATNLSGLPALIADPSPLRDRDLIHTSAGKQVDGLDIVVAGQPPDRPTKLRKVGPEWRLYGGPGDPQKASDPVVTRIVEVLTAKRAIKDFPAPNPANFAAIAATVYVWVDGFNPPIAEKAEPAKKNEPVKIEFGRKEGETVFVRRTQPGKPPEEFALPTVLAGGDVVQSVAKSRLDLLDQTLPSFSDMAVTKVTVTGTNTYTLAKDEKPDPLTKQPLWRFTAPDPQKGKVADAKQVENLLTLLATSQGSFGKFVDEAPANAAEYGLAPPRLKIVVDLGGKGDAAREYEFGKDTPSDPDKVYARVAGKPAVFTIQRRVLDQFVAPDLRDRMLFRQVDPAKATKVELKGWGSLGFPIDLVFERNKEGVWAVTKGPMGYVLMPSKVDAFLGTIAKTRVKGFVPGPVQPAHGFGDPKVNLGVTVTLPDGLVLGLNIGAETDNGASYFGWTTWASESSLLLDAAPFREYKTSPGAFAK